MKTLAKLAAVGASGALLAGIGAGVASADGPESDNATVTVAVDQASTFALDSPTIDLGHGLAGMSVTGTDGYQVTTNDPNGWAVQVSGSDFVGPETFPIGTLQLGGSPVTATPSTDDSDNKPTPVAGTHVNDHFAMTIPNVRVGAYQSTLTYNFVPG